MLGINIIKEHKKTLLMNQILIFKKKKKKTRFFFLLLTTSQGSLFNATMILAKTYALFVSWAMLMSSPTVSISTTYTVSFNGLAETKDAQTVIQLASIP